MNEEHNHLLRTSLMILFRGLYERLMLDPVIRDSLCMFLPYLVSYKSNVRTDYTVFLLYPVTDFGINREQFRTEGTKFLDANAPLLETARTTGRSKNSAAHARVAEFNNKTGELNVFEIDPDISGKRPYSYYKSDPTRQESGVEYDIKQSGDLFPTFGIIRQKDGVVVGAVSIDLKECLQERVVGIFNSYFKAFASLSVWNFSQYDLVEGFQAQFLTRLFAPRTGTPCFHGQIAPEHRETFLKELKEMAGNALANDSAEWLIQEAGKTTDNGTLHDALKPFGNSDKVFQPFLLGLSKMSFSSVTDTSYIAKQSGVQDQSWRELIAALGRFVAYLKDYNPNLKVVETAASKKVLVVEYSMATNDSAFRGQSTATEIAQRLSDNITASDSHNFSFRLKEILDQLSNGTQATPEFKVETPDTMPTDEAAMPSNGFGITGNILKNANLFQFKWVFYGNWK